MKVTELRNKISELIEVVIPLAEAHPCEGKRTELLSVMEGTLRKNIMRIQAIYLLCNEEKLANSALELTRNMIEDAVSIDYMLASDDPEQDAHKFYEFMWVQLKEDLDYYKEVGVEVETEELPNTAEQIEKKYTEAIKDYPEFLNKKGGKPKKSWAGRDVEQMLTRISKKQVLSEGQIKTLVRTYTNGSRKTHFNPVELVIHMQQDAWDVSSRDALRLSLLVSSASLVRLSTRYIDLISKINRENTYHDIGNKANSFLNELLSTGEITFK